MDVYSAGEDFAYEKAAVMPRLSNGTMVPTGSDASYGVEFYMGKVPNFEGTDYKEVPHLRLKLAGDNNRVYDQPVIMDSTPNRPSDPERFPAQWAAFQRGEAQGGEGTLLLDWDKVEPSDVRRMEMNGITTVEQLAAVGDHQLAGLGIGSRALREAARDMLNGKRSAATKERDAEFAALKADNAKMSAIVEGLMGMLTPEQQAELRAKAAAKPAKPGKAPVAA